MKGFLLELFSVLSRTLNVLTGHGADLTFSARAHRDNLHAEKWIDTAARRLFGEQDHCRIWWEEEVRRSKQNVARADAMRS